MRTTSKVSDELFIPSTIWNLESNKFIYNKLCHHWTDTLTPTTCVQVHTVRIMCVQYLQSTMYSYILHVHMCVQYLQSTMHITQVMCSMYLQLHIGN